MAGMQESVGSAEKLGAVMDEFEMKLNQLQTSDTTERSQQLVKVNCILVGIARSRKYLSCHCSV